MSDVNHGVQGSAPPDPGLVDAVAGALFHGTTANPPDGYWQQQARVAIRAVRAWDAAERVAQQIAYLASLTLDEQHERCIASGWEYATTEGQRKAWDGVDTPPEGEGWERNTPKGRGGWERFNYTEESYWRRKVGT